jgi:hypothetical protein
MCNPGQAMDMKLRGIAEYIAFRMTGHVRYVSTARVRGNKRINIEMKSSLAHGVLSLRHFIVLMSVFIREMS